MLDVDIPRIILLFAVFYIIAVIVERIVEFIAISVEFFPRIVEKIGDKAEIGKKKRRIENCQKLIDEKIKAGSIMTKEEIGQSKEKIQKHENEKIKEIKQWEDKIHGYEDEERKEENKRIFFFGIIGLVFSLLICFIPYKCWDIKLIYIITNLDLNFFDWIVSGLFISSGTKPIHDIIMVIEKSKPK